MNNEKAPQQPKPKNSWAMENIGKPIMWIGVGFLACKMLDAYTEGKRTKRISQL